MNRSQAPTDPLPPPSNPWALLNLFAGFSWRFLVCAAALALIVILLVELSFVVVPVFIAILLTSILAPIAGWLKRHGMSEGRSATLTIVFVLLVIVLILILVVPPLIKNAGNFVSSLEEASGEFSDKLQESPFNLSAENANDVEAKLDEFGPKLRDTLISGIGSLAPALAQMLVTFGLSIVLAGYLLLDGERNWKWALGFVDPARRPAMDVLGRGAFETLAAYIRGTSIVAAFNTVAITFGAFVLGLPLLLPLAIIIFFAAFLPIIGAWIAAGLAIAIGFASGGIGTAIGMAIVYLLVSQFKSYFISPFVVGSRVNLAPIVTLLTVTAGTVLGGIIGGIVAVPLMATAASVLGQIRKWRVEGVGDLIPVIPPDEIESGPDGDAGGGETLPDDGAEPAPA
jgi:predicted PurR-regulated permease PerM